MIFSGKYVEVDMKMLAEIDQTQDDKYCMPSLMCRLHVSSVYVSVCVCMCV